MLLLLLLHIVQATNRRVWGASISIECSCRWPIKLIVIGIRIVGMNAIGIVDIGSSICICSVVIVGTTL